MDSPLYNSHPDDPQKMMRKSPPEHQAEGLAPRTITSVSFALKRAECGTEPGREQVNVTGVQIKDETKPWPFCEFVRGDPVGTWDCQEIPVGYNLVGFHGTLSKYQGREEMHYGKDDD